MRLLMLTLCVIATTVAPLAADDWPQWMGPQRDSVWREDGLVDRFPKSGLKVLWRVPVSLGYSGPAVAGGRVYVTDYVPKDEVANDPNSRSRLEGKERVLCLDAKTGKLLWKHEYERAYEISYPGGPRCTPTVDDGRVYTLGAEGDLLCLDAETGKVVWSKLLTEEYDTKSPMWGFAGHPLVDGDRLICLVGGKGSVAVAFDKKTGRELWRALSAPEPGYCPPTMIEHGGVKQLLIWHPESINSLNPETGKSYWSVPFQPDYAMSIAAPRKLGDFLYVSGIGHAAVLLKLDGRNPAEVVWRGTPKTAVYCSNSTPFLEDGIIYGSDCQVGSLRGVRLKDGERLWETFAPTTGGERRASHGTAFLVKHKDRFFLFSETGDLILAKLSPEGYTELDRFHLVDPTNDVFGRLTVWSHPAFANRCVYARNDKELVCVSLADESQ